MSGVVCIPIDGTSPYSAIYITVGLHPGTDSMQRSWGLFPAPHAHVQLILAVQRRLASWMGRKGSWWMVTSALAKHGLCEGHRGANPIRLYISYGGIKPPSLIMSLCGNTEMIHVSPSRWILAHSLFRPAATHNPWGSLGLDHESLTHLSPCWTSYGSLVCRRTITLLNTAWPQLPQTFNLCLEISGSIPAVGFIYTTAGSAGSYALR